MTNYALKYSHWESSFEEFGEDFVTFYFYVEPENENPFVLLFDYGKFKELLQELKPEIYKLLEKAEKSCTKWGPNHSIYLKELEEYGIDIGNLVLEMAPIIFNIKAEIEHKRKLAATPPDLSRVLKEMNNLLPDIKKANTNYYRICEELEKILNQKIIDMYPVLINSSSKHITGLHEILVRHIPGLAEDLCDLINKADEDAD